MITVYTRVAFCPFCEKAKELLADKNIPFNVVVLDTPEIISEIKAKSKMNTVPIIYDGDTLIGGYNELQETIGDLLWK